MRYHFGAVCHPTLSGLGRWMRSRWMAGCSGVVANRWIPRSVTWMEQLRCGHTPVNGTYKLSSVSHSALVMDCLAIGTTSGFEGAGALHGVWSVILVSTGLARSGLGRLITLLAVLQFLPWRSLTVVFSDVRPDTTRFLVVIPVFWVWHLG